MTTQLPTITEPKLIRPSEIASRHGAAPWAERLLYDERNVAILICNDPGQANDAHIHHDFNEWWIVLQGQLVWLIGDYPPIVANRGDVVFCPAGLRHEIIAVGHEPTLRLAISKPGSDHSVKGPRGPAEPPFPDQEDPPNLLHTRLDKVMEKFGDPPWSTSLVSDDRNRANLICHGPGMSNRAHWHPDFDEWWTILKGELTWEVGKSRPILHAREGDIVFVPKGFRHHISTVGEGASLRLAITTPEAPHIYTDDDRSAPPPRE